MGRARQNKMAEECNNLRAAGVLKEKGFVWAGLFIWFPAGQNQHHTFILPNSGVEFNPHEDSKPSSLRDRESHCALFSVPQQLALAAESRRVFSLCVN